MQIQGKILEAGEAIHSSCITHSPGHLERTVDLSCSVMEILLILRCRPLSELTLVLKRRACIGKPMDETN